MRGHAITSEEKVLSWLQTDREGKLTSWRTICNQHCLMRDLKIILQNLIDSGSVIKTKAGYRANKATH